MKRLIYAPKVYIFIRSSNLNGRIYDVSEDVTRGSVTQNTGDVSKATFYLKNRYQKWIRDKQNEGLQIFLPMDMVTIWLQRISGKPIQVFTGYLDSVPYYQAYSGDAMFEASCTLKKLKYTWFDPGLPFFQQWMMSQDGWTYDVTSGEAFKPGALRGSNVGPGMSPGTATGQQANINDSGFAALLGRFMTEVAGWSNTDVLIDILPKNIPEIATQLFQDIQNETAADLKGFSDFMGAILGVNGWSGSGQKTAHNSVVQNTPVISLVHEISQEASNANVPTLVCVFAAEMLSKLNPAKNIGEGEVKGNNWGFGLYSLQPKPSSVGAVGATATTPEGARVGPKVEGYTPDQLTDPSLATKAFCKLLNKQQGEWVHRAKKNNVDAMVTWIEKAIGRKLPTDVDQTQAFDTAKTVAATSNVTVPSVMPAFEIDPSTVSFADQAIQRLLTQPSEKVAFKKYETSAKPWLAAILVRAKNISSNLRLAAFKDKSDIEINITGSDGDLRAFWKSLEGDSSIDVAQLRVENKFETLLKGIKSTSKAATIPTTMKSVIVVQSKQPTGATIGVPGATSTGQVSASDPNAQGGANFLQLAAFSANAAFAANFSFPADYLQATFLTGNRALMNDMSCLDGVKQFCQASLRDFRSLPDGRFLAFYPDYFGASRDAYWSIPNIEIVDFGIQLNDEALATHVYVIGDTGYPDGNIDELDQLSTRGVATIAQAFILKFIERTNESSTANVPQDIGRLADSEAFLLQYGARPHKEEMPIIRNTYYEFLMAWQRFMMLWASQFATTATFTFQPEVMAGGLIAFPDHGIQMYCSTVTHEWDYSSGFSTTATLAAPSLMKRIDPKDRKKLPGFALGGNTNTVGASG